MEHWDTGRLVAYFGGSAVGVSSATQKVKASELTEADTVTLLNYPIPLPHIEITVADITTVGGFLIVLARFVLDVSRERRAKRQRERENERV